MNQPLSVHTMKPLGTQLVEAGYLTESQLSQALSVQKANPDKLLGQVLTETGLLTESQFQDFMLSRISIQQPLGELLINLGYISRDQLNEMLAIQMQMVPTPKPLGQLLIEHELITPETLENILARQREQQDALKQTMAHQTTRETATIRYEPSQITDIQNLLGLGHVFLLLAKTLWPQADQQFQHRFQVMIQFYGDFDCEMDQSLQSSSLTFFGHFLPLLGVQPVLPTAQAQQQLEAGFYSLIQGFVGLLPVAFSIQPTFASHSLMRQPSIPRLSLREALHTVMRSPDVLPHASLQTLRFLLNEFWGQRSLLEQQGLQLVRKEDDVDLEDFFRAKLQDPAAELQYLQRMETHLLEQLALNSQRLEQLPTTDLGGFVAEQLHFFKSLLQTHKEAKELEHLTNW